MEGWNLQGAVVQGLQLLFRQEAERTVRSFYGQILTPILQRQIEFVLSGITTRFNEAAIQIGASKFFSIAFDPNTQVVSLGGME